MQGPNHAKDRRQRVSLSAQINVPVHRRMQRRHATHKGKSAAHCCLQPLSAGAWIIVSWAQSSFGNGVSTARHLLPSALHPTFCWHTHVGLVSHISHTHLLACLPPLSHASYLATIFGMTIDVVLPVRSVIVPAGEGVLCSERRLRRVSVAPRRCKVST
jgi:hypothetical protein